MTYLPLPCHYMLTHTLRDEVRWTPLMQAAYMGHTAVILRLIGHESYHPHHQDHHQSASLLDAVDADGHTALYWAADYGHTGVWIWR